MKKTNRTIKRSAKPIKVFDEYRDLFTLRMKPVPDAFLEKLAVDLLQWALYNNDALKISPFFLQRGIGSTSIKRWRERSSVFNEAYEAARQAIGNRREEGGIRKIFDSGMVNSSMSIYDDEWKENAEWRASLKKEQQEKSQPITVVIEGIPNSNLVPKKKKHE